MATEKEKLQAQADELGLETEGTIAQLKEAIAAANAEEDGQVTEPPPEVVDAPDEPEVVAAPAAVAAPAPADDLPPAPVNPVAKAPKATPPGAVRIYDVQSSFWLRTSEGMALAQVGGTVKLTEKQALKYLRHGNIKLAA